VHVSNYQRSLRRLVKQTSEPASTNRLQDLTAPTNGVPRQKITWYASWFACLFGSLLALPVAFESLPREGLDTSWMYWIHQASQIGLKWGSDVTFTYGPFGWLAWPSLAFPFHYLCSIALLASTQLAVIRRLRILLDGSELFKTLLAVTTTVSLFLVVFSTADRLLCSLAFLALSSKLDTRKPLRQAAFLGFGTGFLLLVKFGTGLMGFAIVGFAFAIELPSNFTLKRPYFSRNSVLTCLIFGMATAASFCLMFGFSNRGFAELPGFISSNLSLANGFTSSMQLDNEDLRWTYLLLPVVAVAGFVLVDRLRDRFVFLLSVYFCFRLGFTRHDQGHLPVALGLPIFTSLALVAGSDRRNPKENVTRDFRTKAAVVTKFLGPPLVCICVSLFFSTITPGLSTLKSVLNGPIRGLTVNIAESKLLFDGQAREDRGRARLDATRFPSYLEVSELLKRHPLRDGQSLGIEPWELALHYPLKTKIPRQMPIFQRYSAYTADLDAINAKFVRSNRSPDFLLYRLNDQIDGRLASFEAPRTFRALLERYRIVGISKTKSWIMLAKGQATEQRCFKSVVVRRRQVSIVDQVVAALWKPPIRFVKVDGVRVRLTDASFDEPIPVISDFLLGADAGLRTIEPIGNEESVTPGPNICASHNGTL
jgi:hypothetical protein